RRVKGLMLQGETRYEEDGQARLSVADLAAPDQRYDLRQGFGRHLDELVGLARMLARGEVGCPKKVNLLVGKTGRRPHSGKTLNPSCFHTNFLEQFPLRTIPGILAWVQPARGDFVQVAECGVAVLLDEENRRVGATGIGSKRHDGGRSRMPNHFELTNRVVGKSNGVDVQVDDFAGIEALGLQCWNSHVNGTLNPSAKR